MALGMTGGFFANGDGAHIQWWEALLLFLLYLCYVFFMSKNEVGAAGAAALAAARRPLSPRAAPCNSGPVSVSFSLQLRS